MGAAEVIAFEEVRASQPWHPLRQQRTGGSPRRLWPRATEVNTSAPKWPGLSVRVCCTPENVSAARSKPWWGQCSLSGPIAIVGPVAVAVPPFDEALGGGAGCKQRG